MNPRAAGASPRATTVAAVVAAVGTLVGCAGGTGEASAGTEGSAGVVLAGIDVEAIRSRHPTSLFGIPPAAARAEVVRVVDGDTVVVALEGGRTENVRLIGIDTPEKPGGHLPAECFGAEATAFASVLLPPGTPVLLTGGAETRDVYDRLLAYVHRATDGLLVNMALAREGYAAALSIAPNTDYSAHFSRAVEEARAEDLGLWAACGGADTPLPE
ncbi:MAG: thermonuclease family protein [bacterium]|nr:thermonuclease family protein [bacterium]